MGSSPTPGIKERKMNHSTGARTPDGMYDHLHAVGKKLRCELNYYNMTRYRLGAGFDGMAVVVVFPTEKDVERAAQACKAIQRSQEYEIDGQMQTITRWFVRIDDVEVLFGIE